MNDTISAVLLIALIIGAYFLPLWIALLRGHRYKSVIFALNLIGGWSGVGWIVALVWAVWPSGSTVTDVVTHDPTGLSARNVGTAAGEIRNEHDRVRVMSPPASEMEGSLLLPPETAPSIVFEVATKTGIRRFTAHSLPCTLGSGPDADVRLRHPSVMECHAIIRPADGSIEVAATSDQAALVIGGTPVRRGNVPFGGRFKVGDVTLTVRAQDGGEPG